MFSNRRIIIFGIIGLFLLSYSASNLISGVFINKGDKIPATTETLNVISLNKNNSNLINLETKIHQIEYFKCGDQVSREINNGDWVGKSYLALKNQFKVEDGWLIGRTENKIYLSRHVDGFCPKHNKRHFGIYKGYLAVYQGPLGLNDKVLALEKSIKITDLPIDLQRKLRKAMSLKDSNSNLTGELKQELEFANEAEVEEAMQNLDEYTE